jgi:hypothetical protein
MSGLSPIHVIETLDEYGFTRREPTPWRGEDMEEWEPYPVDVTSLTDPVVDQDDFQLAPSNSFGGWEEIGERISTIASRPEPLPPPGSVDALAWYLPFHFYGPDWGIYIKEDEVINLAGMIEKRLNGGPRGVERTQQLCRAALTILYLHEAYHHKIESFATRLEIARLEPVYIPYDEHVFRRLLGSDDCLEEGIACSEMITRLKNEKTYYKKLSDEVKDATIQFLYEWIPELPPGYRRGIEFPNLPPSGQLQSQIAHASVTPRQPPEDWDITTHMIQGLFNKYSVAYIIVPKGRTPTLPWLDDMRYLSLSTRDVEKHITRVHGYFDTGRGKGSHRHFHCGGRPPITLPANRETLSHVVQRQVVTALGYKNIRELAARC